MPAPISVVIPTLNSAAPLPATLLSLIEGLDAGLIREVIISDGGSVDDTCAIAENWGATVISGAPSRGGQLKRGGAWARGDWLLFLHSDTVLQGGWSQDLDLTSTGGARVFSLAFRARGFAAAFVAGWANRRTDWFGLPYGDQGLLISQQAYHANGGFDDQPLMEDVAFVRRLKPRPKRIAARAFTSAKKYQTQGWWRRGFRNISTLIRYFFGADPVDLARDYSGVKSEN